VYSSNPKFFKYFFIITFEEKLSADCQRKEQDDNGERSLSLLI
jgi:hypothetical protein